MNLKGPKGLYVRGVTSYPTYIKGKLVAFNLCRFPRNATDRTVLAQFPTPFATIRFEYPREGAPRALKRRGRRVSKSRGMSHNSAHLPCKWKKTNINKVQNLGKPWFEPDITKTPLPNQEVGQQDFEGLLWGPRICGPGSLHNRAQNPSQGE